ncbi:hypothetical protein H1R20_g15362, partial [Candolleomyces eurysporus]
MDRTGNSPPKKGKGWRMAFLPLLGRRFLRLRRGKDTGNPPSGDEQPAPSSGSQMFSQSSNFSIGHGATFNNVAGNLVVYNNNSAESREAELLRMLQLLQRRLPRAMGFTNANGVFITDALGETFTLPWSIVATYEDLHNTLSKHFEGKVEQRKR